LKFSIQEVATREVDITIEPEPQEVKRAMRLAAQQLSRWRPVPGYRPGKAPLSTVERIFGHEALLHQALEEMMPDLYQQAINEAGLRPYQQGKADVVSEDPLVLKVNVALAPEVTLVDYRTLRLEPEPEVAVTEEQIEKALFDKRRRYAEFTTVERPIRMGDQMVATIKGVTDSQIVVDENEGTMDITEELNPPGFAEAVLGMSTGESREFYLTYPEDHENPQLAGKNVHFTIWIKTVRQIDLPEVNDDLAKMAGDWDTVEEMRAGLAQKVKEDLEWDRRRREYDKAWTALAEQSAVGYPAAAVDQELETKLSQHKSQLQRIGFGFEKYLAMMGKTEPEYRQEMRAEAERDLARRLVMSEFIRAENVRVPRAELKREMDTMVASFGEQTEEAMQDLMNSGIMQTVYNELYTRRVNQWIAAYLYGRDDELQKLMAERDADLKQDEAPAATTDNEEAAVEQASEDSSDAETAEEAAQGDAS
jgi:trigger factor